MSVPSAYPGIAAGWQLQPKGSRPVGERRGGEWGSLVSWADGPSGSTMWAGGLPRNGDLMKATNAPGYLPSHRCGLTAWRWIRDQQQRP